MFSSLKYVYGVSFVLILIGALGVGVIIRSIMTDGLELAVARDNVSLSQSYINSVWEPSLATGGTKGAEMFQEQSRRFVKKLTASRFVVYNQKGKRLFVSHDTELYDNSGKLVNLKPDNEVFSGRLSKYTLDKAVMMSGSGESVPISVIQTFYPLPNPAYTPDADLCKNAPPGAPLSGACVPALGAIEIVTDVTEQWKKLDRIQVVSCASTVSIFLVLIAILMLTTHRAEAIIAKQHEINLELASAASAAEAENRDKSQFLANISHELRTPLNAIIGFSEIIKKESMTELNATHQEYIRDIHGSGIHLLSLINDILDFSKAEAGKLELEMTEIDLSKLIINSMRLVIPRAESAQVTLVEDLPSDHVLAHTDGKKLKQVLLNLLSNAVKFTPAGGEVRVSAWEQVLDNKICIQVKDTGIGIAPKDIAKVMTPFGQVDNKLSRKYEGTGLGLPLSKKFIEIMGGQFLIESVVDTGTTITIKLPGVKRTADHSLQGGNHSA